MGVWVYGRMGVLVHGRSVWVHGGMRACRLQARVGGGRWGLEVHTTEVRRFGWATGFGEWVRVTVLKLLDERT